MKRGQRNIVAPGPNEVILPGDELVVLGADEQIDSVRAELEKAEIISEEVQTLGDYELRYLSLQELPKLSGKTIRQSGLREEFHSMIVGIERAGRRIINPDSESVLQNDDKVWLVGGRKDIERLLKEEP